jgi:alcohol dehydrogenase, propanol-preferring
MKAAVLRDFKMPLVVEDVPRPKLADGELLIKVEVCGVCHSDLHVADGDWSQLAGIIKKPLILGHEVVGTVAEVGSGVHGVRIGDRVGVPWIHWTCGVCEHCREGNENLCIKQQITGVTVDGGYAEFVKAPATHIARIPHELDSETAAPLLCAGLTVHRALKRSRLASGQRLAVFGVGGLGHVAVQIGRQLGAEVTAVDISEDKLALARSLGASKTLNAASDNVVKQLRSDGGIHVVLVTSASKAAYDMGFYCVRPTGTLVAVGLPAQEIGFAPILMAAREIRIQASAVGTRQDLREVLDMGAAGKVRCEVATRPLTDVNEVMEQLRRGQISGRILLRPGP